MTVGLQDRQILDQVMRPPPEARPLRIAQVAPLWTSVPPATYGGAELIVHLLTEELVRRGHEVTLFASGDSRSGAKLRAICEYSVIEAMAKGEAYEYEHYANASIVQAIRESASFDVIHCHLGYAQIPVCALSRTPALCTIHIVPSVDDQWVMKQYPEVSVVAVSHSQIAAIPALHRHRMSVIHHGIDFDAYAFSEDAGSYLAFLGRMGPQKSPLDAIRIARAAGMPIVLAGKPQNAGEESYFAEKIEPLIDGVNVVYVGPVDHSQKNGLLKNASALLFPIRGGEAFGLVMIEAMACGTPIVALNTASVPEIVDSGTTGFYGDSVEALVSLVPQAVSLNRRVVRERAIQRFSHMRMTEEYIKVYESLRRRE